MYDIVPEAGYTEWCESNVSSVDNDIIRKYFEKNRTVVTFHKGNETFGKLIRSECYGEERGIEVPVAIMTAFKELFKRFQKYEYSAHTCSFSNYAVHNKTCIDNKYFGIDYKGGYCFLSVVEDESNSSYLRFNVEGNDDKGLLKGLGIPDIILKEELWGTDFSKKYPGLSWLKKYITGAVKRLVKLGVPEKKIGKVSIKCALNVLTNIDFLLNYYVFETVNVFNSDSFEISYVISGSHRYNRRELEAVKSIVIRNWMDLEDKEKEWYDSNYKELGMMKRKELLDEDGFVDMDKYIDAIPDEFYIHQDMDRLLGRESLACIDSDD